MLLPVHRQAPNRQGVQKGCAVFFFFDPLILL
jgi:hypothetical protein